MAQILVRDVEAQVVDRLRQRAQRNGRSLEADVRDTLRQAAGVDMEAALATLKRIQAGFGGRTFSESTELLREDRER